MLGPGTGHGSQWNGVVESRQPTAMLNSEGQKVDIRELTVSGEVKGTEKISITQGDRVGPKGMIAARPELLEPGDGIREVGPPPRVRLIRDDPNKAVLGQGTGRPAKTPIAAKPLVGSVVMDMHLIEERDEHIDVQERHHGLP